MARHHICVHAMSGSFGCYKRPYSSWFPNLLSHTGGLRLKRTAIKLYIGSKDALTPVPVNAPKNRNIKRPSLDARSDNDLGTYGIYTILWLPNKYNHG